MARDTDPSVELSRYVGRALGTSLQVVVTNAAFLEPARIAVERTVAAIDETCSRFREDSEIRRLESVESDQPTPISPLLMRALREALRAARITDGDVDPTVGTAMSRIGYVDDYSTVAAIGGPIVVQASKVPGWQVIALDESAGTVFIPHGVEIDLGSTAKALASDLAATAASAVCADTGVLVSLGGDIAVAGPPPAHGWAIAAAEDSNADPGPNDEVIAIVSGGVATSSTTVRRWIRGDVAMHHIVDPRTGQPTDGPWRTVTVVAGSCLDANIAATGAVVRGTRALPWLESLHLPARLIDHAGRVTHSADWPLPEVG